MNQDILNQTTREEILKWDGKDLNWLARIVVAKPWKKKTRGFDSYFYYPESTSPPPLTSIYPNVSDENILRIIVWELKELPEVQHAWNMSFLEVIKYNGKRGEVNLIASPVEYIKAAMLAAKTKKAEWDDVL